MQYGIEGRELTRNRMGSPEFQSVFFCMFQFPHLLIECEMIGDVPSHVELTVNLCKKNC